MADRGRLSPSVRGGLLLALQVLLSVALFAVLQFLAFRHNVRFDLTPLKSFVLSPHAKQVAEAFDRPALITVFYSSQEGGQRREMLDLLEQFRSASPQIQFRMFDLDRSPGLANRYNISSYNSGVVEVGKRVLTLRSVDEAEITNALLSLSSTKPRQLCFVTGHGERSPNSNNDRSGYSEVAKDLEQENFTIRSLRAIPMEGVPPSCTIVVLAGPSHELLPGESDSLLAYLRSGGKVFLLVDPDAPPSVIRFLHETGVQAENDLIVDESNRFVGADSFMPHVLRFRSDTFRNRLDAPAVLSLARTIRPLPQVPEGIRVTPVATTSPDSWAMMGTGLTPDESVRFRPDVDQPGPLSIAVLVDFLHSEPDAENPTPNGRMMVVGDSDFATNFYLNILGNKDFFMSSIAVLAEDQASIAVRHKGLTRGTISPISLTAEQGRQIFWTAVVFQPLFFVAIGGVMLLRRRRRGGGR